MTKKDVRNIILLGILSLLLVILFTSCGKWKYDSPYSEGNPIVNNDTSDWHDNYADLGVLDNPVAGYDNVLVGTKWVLTQYRVGFGPIQQPYDTLYFLTNTTYNINNGGGRGYTLATLPLSTNKQLTLHYFFPFGGSHYSAQVGSMFVEDWVIYNASFIDLQNSSTEIQAYFTRIL